jgi:WD40 repeat protein
MAIHLMPGPEQQEPESLLHLILRGHRGQVNAVTFAPDGRTLASGSLDGGIILWDTATRRPRAALPKGPECITALVFAPDSRTLAWNGSAACLTLCDVDRDHVRATLR